VAPADLETDGPCLATASLVAWRWAFERVGAFDPSLPIGEDTDWVVRATGLGVTMAIVPQVLLMRRLHEANLSSTRSPAKKEMMQILRASIGRKRVRP
jgi:GT2 family glycosyltransferase